MHAPSRRVCLAASAALLTFAVGCQQIDEKRAFLYQKNKDGTAYTRPAPAGSKNLYYGGNVVFVPPEAIVAFAPERLNIGWLKDPFWRKASSEPQPLDRAFPEKSLWLVVNIEGFASDDFLRTSSKRTFLASAVKQDQLSQSLLALNPSELRFNIKTNDYQQHEVTITLYQVDNFKLKQLIGAIKKENEGLIKIGFDAGSAALKKVAGMVADPLLDTLKGLQKRYGNEFLFERLLLSSGATKEFESMIYLVTSSDNATVTDKKPSEAAPTREETFVLLDPTALLPRETAPAKSAGSGPNETEMRTAYQAAFDAIHNPKITDKDLAEKYRDYLLLKLSYTVDNNANDIMKGALQKELSTRKEARDKEIASLVASNYAALETVIQEYKATAQAVEKPLANQAINNEVLRAMADYSASRNTERGVALVQALGDPAPETATERTAMTAKAAEAFATLKTQWGVEFADARQRYDISRAKSSYVVKISSSTGETLVPALSAGTLRAYVRAMTDSLTALELKLAELRKPEGLTEAENIKQRLLPVDDLLKVTRGAAAPAGSDADKTVSAMLENYYHQKTSVETKNLKLLMEAVQAAEKKLKESAPTDPVKLQGRSA